jgi:hypothetical protein
MNKRYLCIKLFNCLKVNFMIVSLSICPFAWNNSDGFSQDSIFEYLVFRKFVIELQVSLKSDKNEEYFI